MNQVFADLWKKELLRSSTKDYNGYKNVLKTTNKQKQNMFNQTIHNLSVSVKPETNRNTEKKQIKLRFREKKKHEQIHKITNLGDWVSAQRSYKVKTRE